MKNATIDVVGVLAFPDLFQPDDKYGRYGVQVLVPKGSAEEKQLTAAVDTLIKGAGLGRVMPDKLCLRDGDLFEFEGFPGNMVLRASNVKRVPVLKWDLSPLAPRDNIVHSGNVVKVKVELWAQDNEHAKRVNATLLGVQVLQKGQQVSSGAEPSTEGFEAVNPDDYQPPF